MVVLLTVRFTITLIEVACAEFLIAVGANEVLRMPHAAQSCHYLANNRLLTGRTASFAGTGIYALVVHVLTKRTKHRVKSRIARPRC